MKNNKPFKMINGVFPDYDYFDEGGLVSKALRTAKKVGGEVWNKPRPKDIGKPEKLTSKEKSSAKRMAKAAGRPYPNLVDNMRAAREEGGRLSPLMEEKIRDIGDAELAKYGMGPDAPSSTRDTLKAGPEQSTWEKVAEKAMGDRPSPERRRFVEGMGTAADVAHVGSYFTPVGPYVGALDFARGVASGDPVEAALGATGLPGKGAKAAGMAASAMMPESAEAGPLAKALNAIRAYHGSPHKFDRFDISKIGTGEGAQAYGHGLYFAGNEGVARSYRDALANNLETPEAAAKSYLASHGSVEDAIKAMQDHARGGMGWSVSDMENLRNGLSLLKSGANLSEIKAPGHMYEVDIHANPEHMLDWDKPLGEQSAWKKIAKDWGGENEAAERLGINPHSATGRQYVSSVAPQLSGSAYAGVSERLKEAGIPGIRYFDAGSRGAGEGSSNYVVFDPDIIEILRRYAQGGAVDNALRIAKRAK